MAARNRRATSAVAAALLLAGCATGGSLSDLPAAEMRGHATVGEADRTWFTACGPAADEPVWVTFTERSVTQRTEAMERGLLVPGTRSFVRWRAAAGSSGATGVRVGPGDRYLLVREILEVRTATDGDCDGSGP